MFKLNTTKEIFYIFLWLIGIIAFYGLVHTYILEPKSDTSAVHTPNHLVHETAVAEPVVAHASIDKKKTEPIKTEKITAFINTTNNTVVPITLTNDVSEVVKDVKKRIEVDETHAVAKTVEKTVTTKKESLAKEVHMASTAIDTAKSKKDVVVSQEKTDTIIATKAEPVKVVEEKHTPTISTPAVPSIPSVVTAVSVPSVPTAPAVLSTPNIVKDETQKVEANDESKNEDLDLQIEKLKHELSADDKMKLLESARQLVIEKAEAARDAVIKTIK